MTKRRERLGVIHDFLRIVQENNNSIKPTPLLRRLNLSSKSFKEYFEEMKSKGFIKELTDKKGRKYVTLTDKGFKYLESDGIDADDDFTDVWYNSSPDTFVITNLYCVTDTGTVTGMFQVDDGTPTDVDSTDLVCDSSGASDAALDFVTTVNQTYSIDWATTSTDTTPTDFSAFFGGYYTSQ